MNKNQDFLKTVFVIANHLPVTSSPLPTPFYEICVVGKTPALGSMRCYADGIAGLSFPSEAYSELPALFLGYELFKDSTHLGFMHYRRSFTTNKFREDFVTRLPSDPHEIWRGNLVAQRDNRNQILQYLEEEFNSMKHDIVLPTPLSFGNQNLYDQFCNAHPESEKAFQRACEVYDSYVHKENAGNRTLNFMKSNNEGHFWNMFIAKTDLCGEWLALLRKILLVLQHEKDSLPKFNPSQSHLDQRWIGALSERLLSRFFIERATLRGLTTLKLPVSLLI